MHGGGVSPNLRAGKQITAREPGEIVPIGFFYDGHRAHRLFSPSPDACAMPFFHCATAGRKAPRQDSCINMQRSGADDIGILRP
jgi:hypothetical protein